MSINNVLKYTLEECDELYNTLIKQLQKNGFLHKTVHKHNALRQHTYFSA